MRGVIFAGALGLCAALGLNLALSFLGASYRDSIRQQIPTRLDTPGHSELPPVKLEPGVIAGLEDTPRPEAPDQRPSISAEPTPAQRKKRAQSSGSPSEPTREEKESGDSPPSIPTFSVDRAALSRQFRSLADLARHGRYMPNQEGELRRGLKFVEVAPGGVFAQLGLQQGDIVLSVNGVALNTQEDVLVNFDKMRKMHMLTLALERDGVQMQQRYILK